MLREGEGKEKVEEFTDLLENLHLTYAPEGPMEGMLVERIAVGYWRLRRAIRFETGMLREECRPYVYLASGIFCDKQENTALHY